ncbi:TRAP transporter small permease [uncultured Roseibium sp.]|uniref:TRAP transporter small permease n=1 Tax=uncultured Roseibium sp. TaxID=1936171 RepID=UPI00260398FE|nr:TRAP transporter small permease [uncultured Roseibium sp.]
MSSILSVSREVLMLAARLCRTVSVFLLALMAILIVAQVAGRNMLDLGMPWADELARFCGVSLVFLGVPVLALQGRHVAVDIVPTSLPERLGRYLNCLSEFAVLAFAVITLIGFQSFLSRAWKFSTPSLGLPNWVFYAPALIGFALLLMISAVRLAELLSGNSPDGENSKNP